MTEIFAGAATALITPFRSGSIDYDCLTSLMEEQISSGIDALVIAGTTGEASTMPDEEHISLIREACGIAGGRVPVIAGTGSNDTLHGIALSKEAEKAGADALLLVTPYYNKTSQRGLAEHFRVMARSVSLPVILYNVPSRTALNIEPATYHELTFVENIVGIKECNFHQMTETLRLCGDRFDFYSGEDSLVVPMMSLGGKGVISVAANLVPARILAMTHAWLEGDIVEARRQQIELMPLIDACFSDVNPIPVKQALNMMGRNVGECRLPLVGMDEVSISKLAAVLRDFGLLTA